MDYTITLGKGIPGQLIVELYSGCPVDIPVFVTLGINNRMARYSDWLNSCINNENNENTKAQRLRFLAFIHKVGTEKGSICIQSKHALKKMQVLCVKNFLIDNKDFLNDVLPYIFQDVTNISDIPQVKA